MISRKKRRLQQKKKRKIYFYAISCIALLTVSCVVTFQILEHTKTTQIKTSREPARIITQPLTASSYSNLQKTTLVPKTAGAFDSLLEKKRFTGTALIVKDNQIILEKGYGYSNKAKLQKNTVHSHFQIGSIQKSMTAAIIAQLIEAKKLTFQTKLADFFPNISGSEQITIKQMLNMVSGLTIRSLPDDSTNERFIMDEYIQQAYGTKTGTFHYAPINYNLLAGIIEQLTKQSYWKTVKENLLDKGGLHHTNNYVDWFQRADHTTSYQIINQKDYAKVTHPPLSIYAREIGTGNIDMSVGDLYWYYRGLTKGTFFSQNISTELYQPLNHEVYAGGLYVHPTYYRSRGEIANQQTLALFDKKAETAVILMSNQKDNQLQMSIIQSIYSTITNSHVRF